MSNIEKIKAEIERRIENYWSDGDVDSVVVSGELEELIDFIDSLPEEKPSEDLEDAAEEYADKHGFRVPYDGSNDYYDDVDVKASKDGFLAGAEWQREQLLKGSPLPEDTVLFHKGVEEGKRLMMEDAVEGEIGYWNQRGLSIRLDQSLEKLGYGEDTKVKIIIVKE